ncbi:glutamate receptor 1.2 isoform X2 [Ziziphus jujuba]|uniref:Glutamate receptor n=1 Tax=Ziziphus jujuba TaxID=326968 RepID=A0ABM3IH01_ZIZJJ|nr:glutamate receptor 1.2 isoform X2 [Ziziphus jujuba]
MKMDMESKRKNLTILIFAIFFFNLVGQKLCGGTERRRQTEVHVGVILDMDSKQGKIIHSCVSMAISNFYSLHNNYATKLVLHTRDSKGQLLQLVSSALNLLDKVKVEAIIGAQTIMEANFLAELGEKAGIPTISLSEFSPLLSRKYPFLVQSTQDETSQFKGIVALIEAFNWRYVILIYEDSDFGKDILSNIIYSFHQNNINIIYKMTITNPCTDEKIIEELHKLMTFQSTVFIVHVSQGLLAQLVVNAKKIGMMNKGYAWLLTATTMNLLHFVVDTSVIESMQGIIGFKSYIPKSKDLYNLTSTLRRRIYIEDPFMEVMELNANGIWAYDSLWALAEAVERAWVKLPPRNDNKTETGTDNLLDVDKIESSEHGPVLLKEILKSKMMGISGEFQFKNGIRKSSSNAFEIVNVIGKGERRVGVWKESHRERNLLSTNDLEGILWPGGTTSTPKGTRSLMGINGTKLLRVGVPSTRSFKELVSVYYDHQSNETKFTGFCIDVFKAAIELLPYRVPYQFVESTPNHSAITARTYVDFFHNFNHLNYDAIVADTTIMSERSPYVDFTMPYTEIGVGMVVRNENKNMWIFLKPLSLDFWLTTASFFIIIGFIVWIFEHPINQEFQGSPSQQIGTVLWFSFSTLVFAHREKLLSNFSKFIVIVWVFVVLILTSSYTATLTSMMTIQQIQLKPDQNYVGYQFGSLISSQGGITNKLHSKGYKPYNSPEEYAKALSKGSKHGGVSAIIDEIPYIKIFLAKYPGEYSMIQYMPTSNGFGFVHLWFMTCLGQLKNFEKKES